MTAPRLARRDFGRWLLACAAWTLPGCGPGDRYTDADEARLEAQRRREARESGTGPDGPQRYRGYRGLAALPWYEIDGRGRLVCTADVPEAVDIHAHLGMSMLFAPDVDLLRRTDRVAHLLDCDRDDPGCELDLDVYMNAAFTESELGELRRGAVEELTIGSPRAATHTIPNLIDEMDDVRVGRATILPIAFGLPFGDDLTERWMAAIEASGKGDRLIPGASVHPRDDDAIVKLRGHAEAGARVVKLHPAAQRFYADAPEAMAIYEECGRLGLPVVFHAGRAGIEPEYTHRFTLMRHYEPMLRELPDVRFVLGHAGARDVADAIPLAERYENAWLGLHGQGVTTLREIVSRVDTGRLLFGSDWPFYHLAASHAKILMVTEGRPALRSAILRDNARRLLGLA
jgi:predicted TIM-barrel fold metal-dependent hydrolase